MSREDDRRITEKLTKKWLEEHDPADATAGTLPPEVNHDSILDFLSTDWQSAGPKRKKADTEDKYRQVLEVAERLWDEGDHRDIYEIALHLQGRKTVGGGVAYTQIQSAGKLRKFRDILKEKHSDRSPSTSRLGRPTNK